MIVYIIINACVVLLILGAFRRPCRRTCGVLSGLVLLSSSLFHLLYGEGHVTEYELYSWKWWIDTYEVTVQVTYLLLFVLYSWSLRRMSLMYPLNLTYLGMGWVYWWAMVPTNDTTIAYNALGVLLGSLWTVERLTSPPLMPKTDEHVPLSAVDALESP